MLLFTTNQQVPSKYLNGIILEFKGIQNTLCCFSLPSDNQNVLYLY